MDDASRHPSEEREFAHSLTESEISGGVVSKTGSWALEVESASSAGRAGKVVDFFLSAIINEVHL